MNEDDYEDTLRELQIHFGKVNGSAQLDKIVKNLQSNMQKSIKSMGCSVSAATTMAVQAQQAMQEEEEEPWDESEIDISQAYSYKHTHTLIESTLTRLVEGADEDAYRHLNVLTRVAKVLDPNRVNKGMKLLTVQQVLEE